MKKVSTLPLSLAIFRKHLEVHGSFEHYTGIVALHGLARLATETNDKGLLGDIREALMPFVKGEKKFKTNFLNYYCGGNASAWMIYRGYLPEATETVRFYAEEIMNDAPRDKEGILVHPERPADNAIWIDVAFAVTPFLLFAGLALEEEKYIEEAFQQTAKMSRAFLVKSTGLYIQAVNYRGKGHRSQDHWSRGNGWIALALSELVAHLPQDHPRRAEAVQLFQNHVRACAQYQNDAGLWHQEMTEPLSYVETSGSGLMLYALGVGLETGLIEMSERPRFEKGLRGLLAYINENYDVYHTCRGCLCPGDGTKLEYMARPPVLNDLHAFGPVVLAMGQAHLLGITEL